MSAALGSGLGAIRTSVEVVDIRPLTADAALVSCIKTVYDERPDAGQIPPTIGALTYVTVRTSTGWKIGLAQTTPVTSEYATRSTRLRKTVPGRQLAREHRTEKALGRSAALAELYVSTGDSDFIALSAPVY